MNILITGGLGHIGSHLIRRIPFRRNSNKNILEPKEDNITVVDDFTTQRYCSLFNLPSRIHFLDMCISKIKAKHLKDVDIVIHLAAITDAESSFKNKENIEKVNLDFTKRLIGLCDESECRFIFPSSTSVYGVSSKTVHEDNDAYLNPQSPYAETKIAIEKELMKYKSGSITLRLGTVFGTSPGMRFHTAINKFCYQAALGKPLTVWKENYHQKRPYLGLNDAAQAIIFMLENDAWDNTYNVLTNNYKLSEIIKVIKNITKVEIEMVNSPLLNQFSYEVSSKKIENLGWKPQDKLTFAIRQTLRKISGIKK